PAAPGVFHRTGAASALFHDLPGLCRAATHSFYEIELGLKLEESFLIPIEESLQEHLAEVEAALTLSKYLDGLDTFYYPVAVHADELRTNEEAETLRLRLAAVRERLRANHEATGKALARLKRLDERLAAALCARALAESGIPFRARD